MMDIETQSSPVIIKKSSNSTMLRGLGPTLNYTRQSAKIPPMKDYALPVAKSFR
jgi:hypothetical protein